MERRNFLGWITKIGGATAAGVVVGPAVVTTLSPALTPRVPLWTRVGGVEEFPAGLVRSAVVEVPREDRVQSLRKRGVFVLRESSGQLTVFSRTCTDLGCPVTWDPGSGWFFCPCHGGIFDREGTPRAGPPKRPLYRYATRIDDGVLMIDLNSLPPMV